MFVSLAAPPRAFPQRARQRGLVIAVITEFGKHIGGLTSGGLGWTDIGNKAAIGGFAREFYKRLGKHYGKDEAWTFEPHVAEESCAHCCSRRRCRCISSSVSRR